VSNTDEADKEPPTPKADPNATVIFTAEDVEKLEREAEAVEEAAAQEDPLVGTLLRDKWKVLKRLGAGSFGTVYKVTDVKGGWTEALKILGVDRLSGAEAEEMRARFLREAQIMKRLGRESQHIVGLSTYEEDIEAGLIYFLMEFVEGRSLADALGEEGPFAVDRTVRLAVQVCDALMAAHEGPEPVVHRDLKLENLMLTKDRVGEEMVKVLDFGIAKIAEREADSRLTTVGTLGTPGYAAPEQLRAEAVDGRTDLFAFGVILYALLTGRDPWLGNLAHEPTHQIYELMVATDRAEVRPLGEAGVSIPPAMVNVVMKLLRRDPAQRFQSARELRDTLQSLARGATVEATPAPPPEAREAPQPGGSGASPQGPRPRPRKSSRSRRIAATLLLLVAAGATVWARPWGRTLELDALVSLAEGGAVPAVWLADGGIEGGIRVVPLDAASDLLMPFFTGVLEGQLPETVSRLREAGVTVDVSWEAARLTSMAMEAQGRNRYFGLEGGDVQSYALRLAHLVPDSPEAASLLLKVGERMAWDAEAAIDEGPPDRAEQLVRECLSLVPDHPRCLEVPGSN
jgi:serine/threonine protein kinase